MIVVADTTPLNYLIIIEAIELLPKLFGAVYAPPAVVRELAHPRSPMDVWKWATSAPEWLIVQAPTQLDFTLRLGAGETEAISLANELRADLILIDERRGCKAALARGLKVVTTLAILEEAACRKLIDFGAVIERLDKGTTFYLTEDILDASRRRVKEQLQGVDENKTRAD